MSSLPSQPFSSAFSYPSTFTSHLTSSVQPNVSPLYCATRTHILMQLHDSFYPTRNFSLHTTNITPFLWRKLRPFLFLSALPPVSWLWNKLAVSHLFHSVLFHFHSYDSCIPNSTFFKCIIFYHRNVQMFRVCTVKKIKYKSEKTGSM